MATAKTAKNARLTLGFLFAFFLVLNAVIDTLALLPGSALHSRASILPEEISPGIRVVLFVIGIGLSWLLARTLFKFLINGQVSVGDSTDTSYTLLFYLLLTFATFAFLGVIGWFWLPVLFFVVLVYSIFTMWKLLGGLLTAGAVVLTGTAIIITWLIAA